MKKLIIISILIIGAAVQLYSQPVNGEILSDSNNVTIIKLWGTSEERGFAYGYLLGDKMIEVFEGTIIPFWGDDWLAIKEMIAVGINIHIDSVYWHEAQAMMDGATEAGFNNSGYDSLDVIAGNCWHDLFAWGFEKANKGFHCSALMNWGEATVGTDLDGCSVISRHADETPYPAAINNAVVVVHVPSEEGLQPWLLIGYAGDMAPYSGISSSGLSIFSTSLDDQIWNYNTGVGYEPFKFTFRKALESNDYNQDGVNNMLDIRDAISSNPLGYSWGWNFAALGPSTAIYDSLIALVAEVAPESPYITFRDNSYNDTIPGDNLFAANSQIKRHNYQHYCWRYYGIVNHIGNGTGISSQQNWDLMKNYTNLGNNNLQFMQYIPEWGQLNLSVYQNNSGAYLHDPVSYDLNEFFAPINHNIINVPGDYPTIQEGINVANDGDTVLVQPGAYIENINYSGKNITVASLCLFAQDTTNISQTIIDGGALESVITFENGEDSKANLIGFTLINGQSVYGGGVNCSNSSPTIKNVIIANNAADYGGGFYCSQSSPKLINVTIANNTTIESGGGIYSSNSNPNLINCILWNNTPEEIGLSSGGTVDIIYSNIQGGWPGAGNINVAPSFVGTGDHPYALSASSLCIDVGWPADWYMIPVWDLMRNVRIVDGDENGSSEIDMGAYEFVGTSSSLILGDNSSDELFETNLQIYPNPFAYDIEVRFNLNEENYTKIEMFSLIGRRVAILYESKLEAGEHKISFSDHHLSDGIYFCRLQIGNEAMIRKVIKLN